MTLPEVFTAQLILATGSRSGLSAPMMDGYYMIGRHDECQIRPKSRSVSRRHCLIHNASGTMKILDLESASGTHVCGQRIQPKVWKTLKQGDQIRCGKICFNVVLSAGNSSVSSSPSTSMVSGHAFDADDIADFLSSADDCDRQKRYQAIRSNQASTDDSNDEFFDADENLDFTDVTDVADELALAEPTSVAQVLESKPIQVPATPILPPNTEPASSEVEPLTPVAQKTAKKEKNIAPPKKNKRARSTLSLNPIANWDLSGSGLKMILVGAFFLMTLGFLGYQIYRMVSGPEVRIIRGID